MRRFLFIIGAAMLLCLSFSSCKLSSNVMKEPNIRFEFNSNDIILSEQFTAEAKTIRVLGINWKKIFVKSNTGHVGNVGVPVLGALIQDETVSEALYNLMQEHPGYDVVVYPQYHKDVHKPVLGTHFYSKTSVKVTARLGKLKSQE